MRDSTINRMIDESKRIYRALAWCALFLVAGVVILIRPETINNSILFSVSWIAIIVSLVIIALNILLINGLNRNEPPPPPVTYDNPSDALLFDTSQRVPDVRMEITRGNTIRLGKHHPDYGTWGDLGDVLEKHNWRFSRDIIANSFLRITERYPAIRKDFIYLEFVEGKGANQYLTRTGQTFFIEQSDNLYPEHMRLRR